MKVDISSSSDNLEQIDLFWFMFLMIDQSAMCSIAQFIILFLIFQLDFYNYCNKILNIIKHSNSLTTPAHLFIFKL